eukprot:TRINITY_DN14684_c0_g1_i1.p1 TRINITY_DN14684_c0_g1~~TRINITY_DN14684_c0_g1_i1.p1  ORF type:complete len:367 (-),score=61.71 TRINITY_DN14684_c0_g1_i1:16-1116(-)
MSIITHFSQPMSFGIIFGRHPCLLSLSKLKVWNWIVCTFFHRRLQVYLQTRKKYGHSGHGSVDRTFQDFKGMADPKLAIEKWMSRFTHPSRPFQEVSELELPDEIVNSFQWKLSMTPEEILKINKRYDQLVREAHPSSSHNSSVEQKIETRPSEADYAWDDVNFDPTDDEKKSVFAVGTENAKPIGSQFLQFQKGDVIKLVTERCTGQVWFGTLLGPCPPLQTGSIIRRCVTVTRFGEVDFSFPQLMYSRTGLLYFTEYLKAIHSEEHVIFWNVANDYYKDPSNELAKAIFETYVANSAPQQVNIGFEIRKRMLNKYETCIKNDQVIPRDLFCEAQIEVYSMLKTDSYPKFRTTTLFKRYMKKLGS